MYPELFKIPYIDWPLPTYGLMMVIGFIFAAFVIRRLSLHITDNLQVITNACLYCLIAGVVGARLFYVIHHFGQFRGRWLSVFAVWYGGLEFLGGVILAIVVLLFYLRRHKLSIRHYFDILAIGLMLGLAFGRIGCFLKGDCFGKPTDVLWAVRFPYGSDPYRSQVYPNLKRNRPDPHLALPAEFFGYGQIYSGLKGYEDLTQEQKEKVTTGEYQCLPVHPTQLYSFANALLCSLLLYLFWRRSRKTVKSNNPGKLFTKPGCTFALMFILYGVARFFLEILRDDNPFEYGWWAIYKGGTVSQNLGIYMAILGIVLIIIFQKIKLKVVVGDEDDEKHTADGIQDSNEPRTARGELNVS
ncbi:MAG: prolipoprotein diacylglyceryl transferase [Planctomycetota bacterium]|jgi:phosphatidylglycerol:prolipoprotein diacylglycerol transferase